MWSGLVSWLTGLPAAAFPVTRCSPVAFHAAGVPDHSGGSASDSHRLPITSTLNGGSYRGFPLPDGPGHQGQGLMRPLLDHRPGDPDDDDPHLGEQPGIPSAIGLEASRRPVRSVGVDLDGQIELAASRSPGGSPAWGLRSAARAGPRLGSARRASRRPASRRPWAGGPHTPHEPAGGGPDGRRHASGRRLSPGAWPGVAGTAPRRAGAPRPGPAVWPQHPAGCEPAR